MVEERVIVGLGLYAAIFSGDKTLGICPNGGQESLSHPPLVARGNNLETAGWRRL